MRPEVSELSLLHRVLLHAAKTESQLDRIRVATATPDTTAPKTPLSAVNTDHVNGVLTHLQLFVNDPQNNPINSENSAEIATLLQECQWLILDLVPRKNTDDTAQLTPITAKSSPTSVINTLGYIARTSYNQPGRAANLLRKARYGLRDWDATATAQRIDGDDDADLGDEALAVVQLAAGHPASAFEIYDHYLRNQASDPASEPSTRAPSRSSLRKGKGPAGSPKQVTFDPPRTPSPREIEIASPTPVKPTPLRILEELPVVPPPPRDNNQWNLLSSEDQAALSQRFSEEYGPGSPKSKITFLNALTAKERFDLFGHGTPAEEALVRALSRDVSPRPLPR